MEDTVALKPSIYCAVPRLLNKIYDKIMLATLPPNAEDASKEGFGARLKRNMLVTALAAKTRSLREHGQLNHVLWDALLFKKIKEALGMGNVRHMVSGGAPLPVSTADFFKITMGSTCSVHEGYGLTETTGVFPSPRPTTSHLRAMWVVCCLALRCVLRTSRTWTT